MGGHDQSQRIINEKSSKNISPFRNTLPKSHNDDTTEVTALSINSMVPDSVGDVTIIVDLAMRQLQDPAVGYLAQNLPIKPTAQLPPIPTTILSPINQQPPRLPQYNTMTPLERELIGKLQDAAVKEAYLKGKITGLQSTAILQGAYLHRVRGQLETKEGKRNKGGGVLNDGHARLLTEDKFIEKVAEKDRQKALKQAEKDQRKVAMAEYKVTLDGWKEVEEERRQWNANWRLDWKRKVEEWDKLKGKGRGKKPLLGEKKAIPRPSQPSANMAKDSEVSFVALYNERGTF